MSTGVLDNSDDLYRAPLTGYGLVVSPRKPRQASAFDGQPEWNLIQVSNRSHSISRAASKFTLKYSRPVELQKKRGSIEPRWNELVNDSKALFLLTDLDRIKSRAVRDIHHAFGNRRRRIDGRIIFRIELLEQQFCRCFVQFSRACPCFFWL